MRAVIKQKQGGTSVKRARLALNMTQAQLADAAGVCRAAVGKTENGLPIKSSTAHKVAEALGKDFGTLFEVVII